MNENVLARKHEFIALVGTDDALDRPQSVREGER